MHVFYLFKIGPLSLSSRHIPSGEDRGKIAGETLSINDR